MHEIEELEQILVTARKIAMRTNRSMDYCITEVLQLLSVELYRVSNRLTSLKELGDNTVVKEQ